MLKCLLLGPNVWWMTCNHLFSKACWSFTL